LFERSDYFIAPLFCSIKLVVAEVIGTAGEKERDRKKDEETERAFSPIHTNISHAR
jgi:hypothetical protein